MGVRASVGVGVSMGVSVGVSMGVRVRVGVCAAAAAICREEVSARHTQKFMRMHRVLSPQ